MPRKLNRFTVAASATLLEGVEQIEGNQARAVVVVEGEKTVGVLSEGDVMRALLHGVDIHAPLIDHVSYSFKFLQQADWDAALSLIRDFGISLIPVLDEEGRLSEVITLQQMLERVQLMS